MKDILRACIFSPVYLGSAGFPHIQGQNLVPITIKLYIGPVLTYLYVGCTLHKALTQH